MKLSHLLNERLVLLPMQVADKWAAIRALAEHAVGAGALPQTRLETVHEALVEREKSMTTGMEDGIAIPHAAVDGIEDVVGVLGIAPDGIEFQSVDGQPARVVVCLVIPRAKKILHIKTLAEIARLLKRAEVRASLAGSQSPEEAMAAVRGGEEVAEG
ncbi:MAG: PTS sugar transporter subunit IIA [Planctomycetota bacterium]